MLSGVGGEATAAPRSEAVAETGLANGVTLPEPVAYTDPVDWETLFPDAGLRAAVQEQLTAQLGILPADALRGDLMEITSLNAASRGITSLTGLEALGNLLTLYVQDNALTAIDVSTNPPLRNLWATGNPALSPSVPFTRGGSTQYVHLDSTSADSIGVYTMGGAYVLDGSEYTYVAKNGTGRSSVFFYDQVSDGWVLAMGTTDRGVTNSALVGERITRSEVRTVNENGTILHTVTVKNVSDFTFTTAFHQSIDADLNGNDAVAAQADGAGGVILRDSSVELSLQPVSGIERTLTGRRGASDNAALDALVDQGLAVNPAGRLRDDVLTTIGDCAVYYTTPTVTLQPDETYTFSYQETLYQASDPYTIVLDYVTTNPTTGVTTSVARSSRDGALGSVWNLTSLPDFPAGYVLDPTRTAPASATFGAGGRVTTVTIHVALRSVDPVAPPIVQPPAQPLAPVTTPSMAQAQGAAPSGQRLAATGIDVAVALLTAFAAAAVGVTLVLIRRRQLFDTL